MALPPRDVVLILGGGGALGAFTCGLWEALAPRLSAAGARLRGVSGSSIGAINAAFIVQHRGDADLGAQALAREWTTAIATPSFPFLGPSWNDAQRSWNGMLTGLLVGNKALHHAQWPLWNPLAGLDRLNNPLANRSRMRQWLSASLRPYRSSEAEAPLLAMPAVDILKGELRLFDSDQAALTTEHLLASSAIPMMYDPIELDGRLYWDGDLTRESASAAFLQRMAASGRLPDPQHTLLITVDHLPRQAATRPTSGLEVSYRMLDLLLHGKVRDGTQHRPDGMGALHIVRRSLPDDNVSGQFDYSPQRVEALRALGREQGEEAWQAWLQAEAGSELVLGGDSAQPPTDEPMPLFTPPARPMDAMADAAGRV